MIISIITIWLICAVLCFALMVYWTSCTVKITPMRMAYLLCLAITIGPIAAALAIILRATLILQSK